MLELIKAGGTLMLPILACSVIALTIIVERFIALRRGRVMPDRLVKALRIVQHSTAITEDGLIRLSAKSPLGRIIRAGLMNRYLGREIIKESLEDTGRQVVHELERYLNTLGTIASITPLLGLLGTVIGMIEVFNVISAQGTGNTELLADGISKALITTAGGLTVAIPSLLFYRYFRGRVEELVLHMEEEAMHLMAVMERIPMEPKKPQKNPPQPLGQ